jgi:cytochrome c biogenesis protein ResB
LQRFAVLRRFEHARIDTSVVPIEPREKARIPAVLLALRAGDDTSEMWVQKYSTQSVAVAGTPYQISYRNKTVPLGFTVRLEQFNIGFYPGGGRPRSFESHVTIIDPASGGNQSRVISMNNPTSYGGYTLFQSSYRMDGGRKSSYLSVARDPGQPLVFTGYIAMMAGVGIVLITRVQDRHRVPSAGKGLQEFAQRAGRQAPSDGQRRQARLTAGVGLPDQQRHADAAVTRSSSTR